MRASTGGCPSSRRRRLEEAEFDDGRFGKPDFIYDPEEDAFSLPGGAAEGQDRLPTRPHAQVHGARRRAVDAAPDKQISLTDPDTRIDGAVSVWRDPSQNK